MSTVESKEDLTRNFKSFWGAPAGSGTRVPGVQGNELNHIRSHF
jgi:hypothetical protein